MFNRRGVRQENELALAEADFFQARQNMEPIRKADSLRDLYDQEIDQSHISRNNTEYMGRGSEAVIYPDNPNTTILDLESDLVQIINTGHTAHESSFERYRKHNDDDQESQASDGEEAENTRRRSNNEFDQQIREYIQINDIIRGDENLLDMFSVKYPSEDKKSNSLRRRQPENDNLEDQEKQSSLRDNKNDDDFSSSVLNLQELKQQPIQHSEIDILKHKPSHAPSEDMAATTVQGSVGQQVAEDLPDSIQQNQLATPNKRTPVAVVVPIRAQLQHETEDDRINDGPSIELHLEHRLDYSSDVRLVKNYSDPNQSLQSRQAQSAEVKRSSLQSGSNYFREASNNLQRKLDFHKVQVNESEYMARSKQEALERQEEEQEVEVSDLMQYIQEKQPQEIQQKPAEVVKPKENEVIQSQVQVKVPQIEESTNIKKQQDKLPTVEPVFVINGVTMQFEADQTPGLAAAASDNQAIVIRVADGQSLIEIQAKLAQKIAMQTNAFQNGIGRQISNSVKWSEEFFKVVLKHKKAIALQKLVFAGEVSLVALVSAVKAISEQPVLAESAKLENLQYDPKSNRFEINLFSAVSSDEYFSTTACSHDHIDDILEAVRQKMPPIKYLSPKQSLLQGSVNQYQLQFGTTLPRIDLAVVDRVQWQNLYPLARGSFGEVLYHPTDNSLAIKRIWSLSPSAAQKTQAHVLNEVSLQKLTQNYISPQVSTDIIKRHNFWYEYTMERCINLSEIKFDTQTLTRLCEELKENVAKMHSDFIYHRDIKPENVAYSMKKKKLVLLDFGLAMHKAPLQGTSLCYTTYCGTKCYMSPQMEALEKIQSGFIDLKSNDLHALEKTIKTIFENNQKSSLAACNHIDKYCHNLLKSTQVKCIENLMNTLSVSSKPQTSTSRTIITRDHLRCLSRVGFSDTALNIMETMKDIFTMQFIFELCQLCTLNKLKGFNLQNQISKLKKIQDEDELTLRLANAQYNIVTSGEKYAEMLTSYREGCQIIDKNNISKIFRHRLLYTLLKHILNDPCLGKAEKLPESFISEVLNEEGCPMEIWFLVLKLVSLDKIEAGTARCQPLFQYLCNNRELVRQFYPHVWLTLDLALVEAHFKPQNYIIEWPNQVMESIIKDETKFEQKPVTSAMIHDCVYKSAVNKFYLQNCDDQLGLVKDVDRLFKISNNMSDSQQNKPFRNLLNKVEKSKIQKLPPNKSRSLVLSASQALDSRNILIIEQAGTEYKVLVRDYLVTVSTTFSVRGFCAMEHPPTQMSLVRKSGHLKMRIAKYIIQPGVDRQAQIRKHIKNHAVALLLAHMSCGPVLFRLLGYDLLVCENHIEYLIQDYAVQTQRSDQDKSKYNEILKKVHDSHLVLRNLTSKHLARFQSVKQDSSGGQDAQMNYGFVNTVTAMAVNQIRGEKSFGEIHAEPKYFTSQMQVLINQKRQSYGNYDMYAADQHALTVSLQEQDVVEKQSSQTIASQKDCLPYRQPPPNHILACLQLLQINQNKALSTSLKQLVRLLSYKSIFSSEIQQTYSLAPVDLGQLLRQKSQRFLVSSLQLSYTFLGPDSLPQILRHFQSVQKLSLANSLLNFKLCVTPSPLTMAYLSSLNLFNCSLGNNHLADLLIELDMPRLKQLNLSSNLLTIKGVGSLSDSIFFAGLVSLNLNQNNIILDSSASVDLIFKSTPSKLKALYLGGIKLLPPAISTFIKDIKRYAPQLQSLDLSHTQLPDQVLRDLSLRNLNLLKLSRTKLTDQRLKLIRSNSSFANLSSLILDHNNIATLDQLMLFPKLECLDVSHNQISCKHILSLKLQPQTDSDKPLQTVSLKGNQIYGRHSFEAVRKHLSSIFPNLNQANL